MFIYGKPVLSYLNVHEITHQDLDKWLTIA